jgi:DUF4097 and DUF4098 domain-containing protein YvlB
VSKGKSEEEEMESRNRNVWIAVVVVLALAVICCCALLLAALLLSGISVGSTDWGGATSLYQERTEYSFTAGDAPTLEIDNSTGPVTVRAGEGNAIDVVATKRARRRSDVDRNEVDLQPKAGGLIVKAWQVPGVRGASVSLEITAPEDTRVEVNNGTGPIDVSGFRNGVSLGNGTGDLTVVNVLGEIRADAGTGSIVVRGAAGPVSMDTGTGSLRYDGVPQGACRFDVGTGSIWLAVPEDLHAEVNLGVGTGSVESEFAVDGQVTKRSVRGTIGRGDECTLRAGTGTGSIYLSPR